MESDSLVGTVQRVWLDSSCGSNRDLFGWCTDLTKHAAVMLPLCQSPTSETDTVHASSFQWG